MIRISDARLDYFMAEDVPYVDLTSVVLGIGAEPGEMEYFSREGCIVSGVEEVARLAKMQGCSVDSLHDSGDSVEPDEAILRVSGNAASLHQVWKVGLNLLDHLSAVATKTRAMVDAVHAVNPSCEVLTTRKGWSDGVLMYKPEEELIENWKQILFENNSTPDRLNGCPLTDGEMQQILDQITRLRTPLKLNGFINGKTVANGQNPKGFGSLIGRLRFVSRRVRHVIFRNRRRFIR
jgi:hypothetical protein